MSGPRFKTRYILDLSRTATARSTSSVDTHTQITQETGKCTSSKTVFRLQSQGDKFPLFNPLKSNGYCMYHQV
jgi:hypothetical protein